MSTYEGTLKKRIRDDLWSRGIWVSNIANGVVGSIPGDPDMVACYNGHLIAIEGKAPSGSIRHLQRTRQRIIEGNGGSYYYIRNWDQYQDMLKKEGIE